MRRDPVERACFHIHRQRAGGLGMVKPGTAIRMMENVAAGSGARAMRNTEVGSPLQCKRMEQRIGAGRLVKPEDLPAHRVFGAHGAGNDDAAQGHLLGQGAACAGADERRRAMTIKELMGIDQQRRSADAG